MKPHQPVFYILDLTQFPQQGRAITEAKSLLPQLKWLGVTHIWVLPFYPSPRCDYGYDVQNHKDVDPRFGTLENFTEFVTKAHDLGMKVMVDLVPNHTSIDHQWLQEHPEMYYRIDSRNRRHYDGWRNLFDPEQSAPQYDYRSGTYYISLFDPSQADLKWFPKYYIIPNRYLVASFRDIVQFWLENGVDGFRLDAVQAMNKCADDQQVNLTTLLKSTRCLEVVRRVFRNMTTQQGTPPELLIELIDPNFSLAPLFAQELGYVVGESRVWIENTAVKNAITLRNLQGAIMHSEKSPRVVRCLENHDSCRLSSRPYVDGNLQLAIDLMLYNDPHGIIIHGGQEFGIENPHLWPDEHLELDAMLRAKYRNRSAPTQLTEEEERYSRANGRIIPSWNDCPWFRAQNANASANGLAATFQGDWSWPEAYKAQRQDPKSPLCRLQNRISAWQHT